MVARSSRQAGLTSPPGHDRSWSLESRSVSFEDPGESGYEDEGEQPTAEGQPEDPLGGVAIGNEGVSLFEVGDRQQQVEGVSSGVDPPGSPTWNRWLGNCSPNATPTRPKSTSPNAASTTSKTT